jgi:DNA-binding NarL/FixJ family response regulator
MSGPHRGVQVLLVDNEPAVLVLLRRTLSAHKDMTVCGEAADGAQTLCLAGMLHPDVIVLDWHLPDLSGPELVTAVRAAYPSARIVVYTSDAGAVRAAWAAGAHRFLVKGADLAELVFALRS